MTSDLEYLLLKEKGPYHEVYVRRRLYTNPGVCKFYSIVITIITISLVLLLMSLVYVFVLVPSWQGNVLSWDGRPEKEARIHVLTHTQCDLVEGLIEKGVYVFKGIPYAVPPVGARRWRQPEKMTREQKTCWRGSFQAKKFGSSCLQSRHSKNSSTLVGSEDCLFLNIWTQSLDPLANKPVMFWIHGGDFVHGSGHSPPMAPTPEVTKSTHAVYVSINYRLGPFGFLALDVLAQNSSHGTSGNYGLLDTISALEWVRDNIRNFGGNPNKVTVFGQGAGATLIQALLTTSSPSTASLFHRAWLASPPGLLFQSSEQAGRQNLALLNLTGCHEATCLRRLSPADVMKGAPLWTRSNVMGMGDWVHMPVRGRRLDTSIGVVVDGRLLKEPPLQAWKYGRRHDVPMMLTSMAQETDLLPFDPTMSSWSWQHYKATVTQQLSQFSSNLTQAALELYSPGSPTLTPEYQYTTMLSDIRFTCPTQLSAELASRKFLSPVFRAVMTARPSAPVNLLNVSAARYAFHGWDLAVFFGDFAAFGFHPKKEDLNFQKVLRQQMMAFAHEGRPESAVWDVSGMCTALLSDHVFPVEHYSQSRCELWLKNGFVPYSSM